MKIFNWMQNKLASKKSNSVPANHNIQQTSIEDLSDWPHGLLAIGTLGNNNIQQEANEKDCSACSDDSNNKIDHTISVHGKGKDIGKKSLSFLIKKMFVCASGFSSPAPTLRDPILDPPMDKILRTILNKKIYPQSSSSRLSIKKSFESSHTSKIGNEDDNGSSKWVKTDSEYIVLEI